MSKSPKTSPGRPAPLSIRLNDQERIELQRRAGSLPLSTYVKQAALGPDGPAGRRRPPNPTADARALMGGCVHESPAGKAGAP
jgi:hypothetical protein